MTGPETNLGAEFEYDHSRRPRSMKAVLRMPKPLDQLLGRNELLPTDSGHHPFGGMRDRLYPTSIEFDDRVTTVEIFLSQPLLLSLSMSCLGASWRYD